MAYLATIPAYAAVPQATMTILVAARRSSSLMLISSRTRRPVSSVRPKRVSRTACGWSLISFSMKVS